MNNYSNRDYVTENINLKQQIIDLKAANKDKDETIKALKQELLEYNQLRDRFKVLYEENEKRKKAIEILKDKLKLSLNDNKATKTINAVLPIGNNDMNRLTQQEYDLVKEVLE